MQHVEGNLHNDRVTDLDGHMTRPESGMTHVGMPVPVGYGARVGCLGLQQGLWQEEH